MGEKTRGNCGHVGFGVTLHIFETVQVNVVGLYGTNKVGEDRGIEVSSESSTKRFDESSCILGGQSRRPPRVPAVNAVNDAVKSTELVWIGEKCRNEVRLVVPSKLIDELALPTIRGGVGAESTTISVEGGGKDLVVVLQLVRVGSVASDVVTERAGVLRRGAWHHTVPIS